MNFESKTRLVLIAGGSIVVGFLFGYIAFAVIDQFGVPSENSEQEATEEDDSTHAISRSRANRVSNSQLLDSYEGSFEDLESMYDYVGDADEKSLTELLKQSSKIEWTHGRSAIQRVIIHRLTELDPLIAIDHVERLPRNHQDSLVQALVEHWSLLDIDGLLKYAEGSSQSNRYAVLKAILDTRIDLSLDRRIEIAVQLGDKRYGRNVISESEIVALMDVPELAWNRIVQEDLLRDAHFANVIVEIAQETVDRVGFRGTLPMLDLLQEERESKHNLDVLIESLTLLDPSAFLTSIRELPHRKQERLLPGLFETWSKMDPETAWREASVVAQDSGITNIVSIVIYQWSLAQPRELLGSLGELSPEHQLIAIERAITEIARDSIEEAKDILDRLQGQGRDVSSAVRRFADFWSRRDPNSAIDWILSESEDQHGLHYSDMVERGLENLAVVNPQRAFELALDQPIPAFGAPLEARVIREMLQDNLDLALDYREHVRAEGRGKLRAYKYIGQELVKRGSSMQALDLGNELSSEEQEDFQRSVISDWSTLDPIDLYRNLEHIESESTQAMIAKKLLMVQSNRPVLTDEQLGIVRSYVPEGVIVVSDLSPEELRNLVDKLKRESEAAESP